MPSRLVLTQELYTLAARRPEYRELTHEWMRRSRVRLEKHFETEPHGRALPLEAISRITETGRRDT
jgi:DNA-binding transcriptional regulator YbjK